MSKWIYMNIKGQGHLLTLVQGHSDSTFSNFFSLETVRRIEAKFHVDHSWDGGTKICSVVQITRWPPCPYMVKTLKKLLLWNQKADDLESWYAALGTRVLPNLFKWCPWVDVDIFFGKVKFGPICFVWKKVKTMDFFRNYCSLWYKSWWMQSTKWIHEALWVPKVKVIYWPWSKSLGVNIFELFSSITTYFNISSALRWVIQDQWSSGIIYWSENRLKINITP